MYLKVIGGLHVILAFLKVLLLLKMLRTWLLVLSDGSTSIYDHSIKKVQHTHIHAKDKKQYIIT